MAARSGVGATGRVLIVGAGPTGLTLANALSLYGVPFEIVDRALGPSSDSKALAINVLTRLSLELLGLGDEIGKGACVVTRLNVYWEGRRLNPVDFRWLPSPVRSFLTQPQSQTERELLGALERRGVGVRWGQRLVALDTDTDTDREIRAFLKHTSGATSHDEYAFVVGCDGKKSVVREAVGIACHGDEYPMHFLLGDFDLRWDRRADQVHYFAYPDGFFLVAPVATGRFRVVVKRDGPLPVGSAANADLIAGELRRRFGRDVVHGPPLWLSCAPLYKCTADRLRSGRVFLAGDAAHLYSPIGGAGMNTGMQDAFNLAWKLAYVIAGRTNGDALLESYERERLPVIRRTAAVTDASTRAIARLTTDDGTVARFMPSMSNRRILKDLAWQHSGLAQRYANSPAIEPPSPVPPLHKPARDAAFLVDIGAVGGFCVALPELLRFVTTQTGEASRSDSTHLFVFLPQGGCDLSAYDAVRLGIEVRRRYGAFVRVVLVTPAQQPCAPTSRDGLPVVVAFLAVREGAPPGLGREPIACLIRPDGVLAFAGPVRNCAPLLALLARIFSSNGGASPDRRAVAPVEPECPQAERATRGLLESRVDVGGVRIHVVESRGRRGPPVFFCHGNSSSAASFDRLLTGRVGREYRLIAMDFPGHGTSDRAVNAHEDYTISGLGRFVRAVIATVGPKRYRLCGHSLGGHVLSHLLPDLPGAMGLVLVSAPALSPQNLAAVFLPDPTCGALFEGHLGPRETHALATSLLQTDRVDDRTLEVLKTSIARTDEQFRPALGRSLAAGAFCDEGRAIAAARIPIAFCCGSRDPFIRSDCYAAQPSMRSAQIWRIHEAGHSPHLETPEIFEDLLLTFLARRDAASGRATTP